MALTNQPYLPLYIQDWLTNNKLKQCSSGAHGLMINIMCLMHKEETYGKLLLRQKFKQTDKPDKNFALMLAKLLPFDLAEIEVDLNELLDEKVLIINNDILECKRMVKDAEISISRASNGKKGGIKRIENSNNLAQAKTQANTEYENESVNENKDVFTMALAENFNGLPDIKIGSVIELLKITKQTTVTEEEVKGLWEVFKIQNLTGKKFYSDKDAVYSHFINWSKIQKFEKNGTGNSKNNRKLSPSEARQEANRSY